MDWQVRRIGIYRPVFAHPKTRKERRADMELVIIIVIAVIVYLWKDNKRVAATEPDPIQRTWSLGIGWIVIVIMGVWLLLGAAVGFSNINVGTNPDGSFTVTQPHDPNNPMTRPIGEMIGLKQDGE